MEKSNFKSEKGVNYEELIPKEMTKEEEDDNISESEGILNKYDSDEEVPDQISSSSLECDQEENDSESKKDKENYSEKIMEIEEENDKVFPLSFEYDLELFEFIDEVLVQKLNSLNSAPNSIGKLLSEFDEKINSLEKNQVKYKFYTCFFCNFLQKMVLLNKKFPNLLNEIINSLKLIESLTCDLLNNCKSNIEDIHLQFLFQICYLVLDLFYNIISSQNINLLEDFFTVSLDFLQDYLENNLKGTEEEIPKESKSSIKSTNLKEKLNKNGSQNSKENSEDKKLTILDNYLIKYISIIHSILSNKKEFHLTFCFELLKKLFIFSFTIFKMRKFSNFYLQAIDIIIIILEETNDISFINKFIENLISSFESFLIKKCDINDDKKYYCNLNYNLIKQLKSYFGEYKCLNSDNISLFTYTFLRAFTIFYVKENHIEVFQDFLMKILNWNNPRILLIFYCLIDELNDIKYNIEFSVTLPLLTNLYSSLNNFIYSSEFENNKKILFLNILEHFYMSLLKDFEYMKKCFFCIDNSNFYKKSDCSFINDEAVHTKNNNKRKKRKISVVNEVKDSTNNNISNSNQDNCQCFSCTYTNHNNIFICQQCKCSTNLKLQLIDLDKDDNISICGFCNLRSYFESNGVLFDKQEEIELLDSNSELLIYSSKSKLKNKILENNNNENNEKCPKYLFDKLVIYQDTLYKNSFLFVKIALLNYITMSNMIINNKLLSQQVDKSFEIFFKYFINDEKIKIPKYKIFNQNLIQFYNAQKGRIYNIHQQINISNDTIKFFYFYFFYINFLLAGHWRITKYTLTKNIHWLLRRKGLKILTKFINFEGNYILFERFNLLILSTLLSDNSIYLREFTLEILLDLYKNKKIQKGQFINILYNNVNETSFFIRKKIIEILIDIVLKENEREYYDAILYIFIKKLIDNSESNKIKVIIYNFLIDVFNNRDNNNYLSQSSNNNKSARKLSQNKNSLINNNKNISDLLDKTIDIFINLLKDTENLNSTSNFIVENIQNIFNSIAPKIQNFDKIFAYIFKNYILLQNHSDIEFIQALNLIKILSKFHVKTIVLYIEYIIRSLIHEKNNNDTTSNIKDINISNNISNKISEISAEILNNVFTFNNTKEKDDKQEEIIIKEYLIPKIEDRLFYLILNRQPDVMISCIQTLFTMIKNGMVEFTKISSIFSKTLILIDKIYTEQIINYEKYPQVVITKALYLLSYIIFSTENEKLFQIVKCVHSEYTEENYQNYLFNIFKFFAIYKEKSIINFAAFECFGYFWSKFPMSLKDSDEIINYIFDNTNSEFEKITILRTFYSLFKRINEICKIIQEQEKINNKEKTMKKSNKKNIKENSKSQIIENNKNNKLNFVNFDFGILHLFFENFIYKFSVYLLTEMNDEIRLRTIYLLKLIVNLGHVNVHKIVHHIFVGLFDSNQEIKYNSTVIVEKIISISLSQFFLKLHECFYNSYMFQKSHYVDSIYLNSYMKIKNEKVIKISKENVFELLFYKMNRNSNTFKVNFYENIINVFDNISSLENEFNNCKKKKDVKECIDKMEYYEYLCKVIGDFSFSNKEDILRIFGKLYSKSQLWGNVFNVKIKEYIENENIIQIPYSLLYYFFAFGMKSFLIRYYFLKFEIVNDNEMDEIFVKGWDEFSKKYQNKLEKKRKVINENINHKDEDNEYMKNKEDDNNENENEETKKLKKKYISTNKFNKDFFSQTSELKNCKFYEFFNIFSYLSKILLSIQVKKKVCKLNNNDKEITIDVLNKIKEFSNIKIKQFKDIMKKKDKGSDIITYLINTYFYVEEDIVDGKKNMTSNTEIKNKHFINNRKWQNNTNLKKNSIFNPKKRKNRISIDDENIDNENDNDNDSDLIVDDIKKRNNGKKKTDNTFKNEEKRNKSLTENKSHELKAKKKRKVKE